MGAGEHYDLIAEEFRQDLGYLAPGKDSREPIGEKQEAYINELWKAWCKGRMRGLEATAQREKEGTQE